VVEAGIIRPFQRSAWSVQRIHSVEQGDVGQEVSWVIFRPFPSTITIARNYATHVAELHTTVLKMQNSSNAASVGQEQQNEAAEIAALVASLQARLVSSGEWSRLSKQLRRSLEGSEWDRDLKQYAQGAFERVHAASSNAKSLRS
jgi:hypothetical protein